MANTSLRIWVILFSAAQGCYIGKQFLIYLFSLDTNFQGEQIVLLTNPNDYDIDVNISTNQQLHVVRLPCRHTISYDTAHLIGLLNYSSALLLNSSFEFSVKGSLKHRFDNHVLELIHYNILTTSVLGQFYRPSLLLSKNYENTKCAIVSLHGKTEVTFQGANKTDRVFPITEKLNALEYIVDRKTAFNISANETVAVFCGAQSPTNEVRLQIPTLDFCGTDFFIPSYPLMNESVPLQRRVIRVYPIQPVDPVLTIFLNKYFGKTAKEKDVPGALNLTAPSNICVLQFLRRWDPTNQTFTEDGFQFLQAGEDAIDARSPMQVASIGHGTCTCPSCHCPCSHRPVVLTPEERERKLKQSLIRIKKELALTTSELSSAKRRKNSARDDRPSAAGIGAIGVTVLCVVVIIIASCDLPLLTAHVKERRMRKSREDISGEEAD